MTDSNDKIEGLSEKFTQDEWNHIEKKYSPFEVKVLDCLKSLGKSSVNEVKQEHTILGDELYVANRDLLMKPLQLVFPIAKEIKEETSSKKKKEKPLPTKERIILENSKLRAKTHIETVLKTFNGDFQPKYAFNSEIVEIKGIGLLYAGHYLYTNNLQYRKTKFLPMVFTIMVSIEKFISNCQNLEGKNLLGVKDIVSKTLLNDMKAWLDKLKTIYTYNGFAIHDHAPELLVYTEYDKAIPSTGIKPRKHQIELMQKINAYFGSGFLLVYNPPMASGKTMSIAAICSYVIESIRKVKPKFQFIFACNLPPVRDHAAGICYNAGIKFGIGSKNTITGKYAIINHFSCSKDDERVAIITSPEVAYEILSDDGFGTNCDEYMLFVDEPTVGADNINSETLKTNMAVLSVAPRRTILSSATFPDMNLIPNITNYFQQKYSSIVLDTVYSNEIQIGCDVKTFGFDLVVPHLGVKTQTQLKETIDTISKNPFLGRVYTSDVVRSLWSSMKKCSIDVPNIIEIFENVNNMSSDKVRAIAMQLLDILANQEDKIIKEICSSNILVDRITLNNIENKKEKENKKKKDDENDLWENSDEDANPDELDFSKLATSQAWLMPNVTLIAAADPMDFAKNHFYNFVENDIYKHPLDVVNDNIQYYKNTKNILKAFEKEVSEQECKREVYEKSIEKNSKRKSSDDDREKKDKEKPVTKDDIDKKLQEFSDNIPKIKFPDFGHINSMDHIKKYAKHHASKLYGRNVRTPPPLQSIQYDKFNVSDEILTLLFCGVGVYSTIDKSICPNYLKAVLEMASSGLLAYIIADVSICYGTNYPINNIIVTNEFAMQHSINTLFQLFGRAGRVGRSWIAAAYVSDLVARKLIDYVQKNTKTVIEAENMATMFNNYMTKTAISDNAFLNYIIAKYITGKEETLENETKGKIIFNKNKKDVIVETEDIQPVRECDSRTVQASAAPEQARPPRQYNDNDQVRPPRQYDNRPPRQYDNRPPRQYNENDQVRPPRQYDNRPPRQYNENDQAPVAFSQARLPRQYDNRPPRQYSENDQPRPPRQYDNRPPRPYNEDGTRPPRQYTNEQKFYVKNAEQPVDQNVGGWRKKDDNFETPKQANKNNYWKHK